MSVFEVIMLSQCRAQDGIENVSHAKHNWLHIVTSSHGFAIFKQPFKKQQMWNLLNKMRHKRQRSRKTLWLRQLCKETGQRRVNSVCVTRCCLATHLLGYCRPVSTAHLKMEEKPETGQRQTISSQNSALNFPSEMSLWWEFEWSVDSCHGLTKKKKITTANSKHLSVGRRKATPLCWPLWSPV